MDKAADFASEDCGFDSHHGLYIVLSHINSYHGKWIVTQYININICFHHIKKKFFEKNDNFFQVQNLDNNINRKFNDKL